ncbi:MAG: NUDIX domain-containing protein [Oscillospiraceae bacterium]|nr:NUDIX domain-containing protein [Oscillospiraceae bacterium]
MELWDAYDSDFRRIEGMTLVRGEPVPEGCFHLVCDVIVRHRDGAWLLMRRSEGKHHGGMWEASAGGSALRGEGPVQCAARELREETGIVSNDLTELGRVIFHERRTIYVEYLCTVDCDKDSIILRPGETSDYRWVEKGELFRMPRSELVTRRILCFVEELDA